MGIAMYSPATALDAGKASHVVFKFTQNCLTLLEIGIF